MHFAWNFFFVQFYWIDFLSSSNLVNKQQCRNTNKNKSISHKIFNPIFSAGQIQNIPNKFTKHLNKVWICVYFAHSFIIIIICRKSTGACLNNSKITVNSLFHIYQFYHNIFICFSFITRSKMNNVLLIFWRFFFCVLLLYSYRFYFISSIFIRFFFFK